MEKLVTHLADKERRPVDDCQHILSVYFNFVTLLFEPREGWLVGWLAGA